MATEQTPPTGPGPDHEQGQPRLPTYESTTEPGEPRKPQPLELGDIPAVSLSPLEASRSFEFLKEQAEAVERPAPVPGRWVGNRWVEGEDAITLASSTALGLSGALQTPPEEHETNLHRTGIAIPFRWEVGAYVGFFLVALFMRLWELGARAVHHDESLHGYFSWQVFTGNGYEHNPLTHGMFLFHSTAASFFLFGDSDFTLRLPQALFGAALVLLPWLLRSRLGTVGALAASFMLTFSPSLLYFSRFARNDIFMAFWFLGIAAMIWRYIDEGKSLYLYCAAGLLAFAFATKETAYIYVAIFIVALLAIGIKDVGRWVWGRGSVREWSRPAQALVVIGGLTLPLFAAGAAVFQDVFNVTLAAPDNYPGLAPGEPETSLRPVAWAVVVFLAAVSTVMGFLWNRKAWLVAGTVFAVIFVALYSNFLTHPAGVATGIWQSLGYWLAQHGVKRGDQPWYYFFVITAVYEFLPWVISAGAVFYYAIAKGGVFRWLLVIWAGIALIIASQIGSGSSYPWMAAGILLLATIPFIRADSFVKFLCFWAGATFMAYSLAGEKMPWLEVNIALPLIILAARIINDVANAVPWRKAIEAKAWLIFLGAPAFVVLVYRLTHVDAWRESFWVLWIILAGMGLLLLGLWAVAGKIGWKGALGVVALGLAGFMSLITVRTGVIAAYYNGDIPKEMLVYTQTSPALHDLVGEIEAAGNLMGEREKIKIVIDSRSGFTWPWAWYLRNYTNVSYPDYTKSNGASPDGAMIVVVHRDDNAAMEPILRDNYYPGRLLPHRWWFPEHDTYKGLTVAEFTSAFRHPDTWDKYIDYFLYRKMTPKFGSEDAYVYFSKELPVYGFD